MLLGPPPERRIGGGGALSYVLGFAIWQGLCTAWVHMTNGPADQGSSGPTLQLVLFVIRGQRYALPLSQIDHVVAMVEVSPLARAPSCAVGVINVHGHAVPVVDVARRLKLPPRKYGARAHLIVARAGERPMAVLADEVLGVAEVARVAVALPDAVFPGIGRVAGLAALDDGVLLIHDLDTFFSPKEERQLVQALKAVAR